MNRGIQEFSSSKAAVRKCAWLHERWMGSRTVKLIARAGISVLGLVVRIVDRLIRVRRHANLIIEIGVQVFEYRSEECLVGCNRRQHSA
jgi:hypothetical protein